ncbi:dolichol phosphate-mannose biosynthesis regulatory [Thelephora ganbajun]|uniref:Dolichol phosphate-mannose biosynthesis regulatory n=1 Tax=Thelephora ganbajun TaxID=370292 RepID=A0ACB6ZTG0_THEGA|nr:dolichol phosphate-mannose biosynthesis regulatory [Thelephora ganbajun]
MAVSDKVLGGGMLFIALFVFIYYTTWAIILPLIDSSSPVHDYFPDREWAVRLPAFLLVVGLTAIGLFVGLTIVKENKKKAQKARLRTA